MASPCDLINVGMSCCLLCHRIAYHATACAPGLNPLGLISTDCAVGTGQLRIKQLFISIIKALCTGCRSTPSSLPHRCSVLGHATQWYQRSAAHLYLYLLQERALPATSQVPGSTSMSVAMRAMDTTMDTTTSMTAAVVSTMTVLLVAASTQLAMLTADSTTTGPPQVSLWHHQDIIHGKLRL